MSLGSCLVANEISGSAEAFIDARVQGKSWQQIADEFDLPNPSAARKAFEKATGISDFKIKGQALKDLVQQGPNAMLKVNEAKIAAKKLKALDDVVQKKPPAAALDLSKPVQSDFASDVTVANKTGLTPKQVRDVIDMNGNGQGYLAIKDKLGIDFAQIDDVVWNNLLKKNNGFTWKAYVDKPTSESGFNAVKAKVFEARGKGLTIDEIVSKPGAPPKTVVQAILDDKWKLPEAGAKAPIIPPPPPPPPQVFGGDFPSSGTAFRRHSDQELLDWIRGDTSMLSSHQRGAVSNYTNSGYSDINKYLRGGGLTDTSGYGYSGKNVVNQVKRIDETMRPIPVDVTLTRNFTGVRHLPAAPEEMVGKVMWDDAFLSTSIKEAGVFSGDVQLVINARAGTMGRYVNDISVHKSEQEMLLARGTRMVVTKVEKTAHGGGYRYRLFADTI